MLLIRRNPTYAVIVAPALAVAVALIAVAVSPAAVNAAQPSPLPSPQRAGEAPADGLATAQRLFATGRFGEAAEVAGNLGTAEALTLAVRSRLALAYTRPPARTDVCKKTAALAERASTSRPNDAESLRLWAIALGNLARNGSAMAALAADYPERTRALIDRALTLEPGSASAHAMLGAWNAEIVSRLGATMADALYGASADAARTEFTRAITLDPANPILHAEFGRALLQLGDVAKARNELLRSTQLPARDSMESLIQSHAAEALNTLADGDKARAKRLLEPTC